ncbi:MAG TPA: UDP-N-acetylglucosamine 1-carboxyvinyltransferase [Candidatus Marinimicrobia bacterium]|jgi:UDP-N-acetylglucosamine 1-carboxyvinyltransferase|nr:UDP-N-acetylglucosamine 1-carboxyvinyltransferase [Candidatus Neomarinimicrobiota bacterium]MDP7121978.1 UDP-N-acetylglucosamine 1-carboxyvinyltransferase [Candidatus Neomarinimicrobiota bacterium]MDP7482906.1 UDP-N-acetylglucosamine 1-carboxyvinyltransferase [Candidatus Neomarinimicrobiota bacterium]MDP7529009.1 UDP-N-acetylglucosamine 1-carboxyvinyltransferase [Candidatus Neomarinimicrobiota bacterium]MDP7715468.1 UDP-N-acetylglucosamine 1-carboxyvinyltransferase [Candidatus Neomarinimicro|tara:strand:+ start:17598 stop:18854 length:1257 start_codon:yes stop_codon:yes gene_type:complete
MDKLVIQGGRPLNGSVKVSGAKNAVLPIMTATIITPGSYKIKRVPDLRDTRTMISLLNIIGAEVNFEDGTLHIDTTRCDNPEAPYDLVKTMRASFYVLGPLLSRFGYAKVSMPGGCAWGPRPVNFHVDAMEQIGADIILEDGYIIAKGENLSGGDVLFEVSSVGATGNAVMAAVKASGRTTISNAAMEPEITCLCEFLNAMGASISGIGTNKLQIESVSEMKPVDTEIIPDRIETATFLIAGAMAGEKVEVVGAEPNHLQVVLKRLQEAGSELEVKKDSIIIERKGRPRPVSVETAVYPGFPTDVQAQWMALMSLADGNSTITDSIYHDRFTHIAELSRLGADIRLKHNVSEVKGKERLLGAPVMSTDIRASASLILAGLGAEGQTEISRIYHIDRGYEKIEEKFQSLGAEISRESEQ